MLLPYGYHLISLRRFDKLSFTHKLILIIPQRFLNPQLLNRVGVSYPLSKLWLKRFLASSNQYPLHRLIKILSVHVHEVPFIHSLYRAFNLRRLKGRPLLIQSGVEGQLCLITIYRSWIYQSK